MLDERQLAQARAVSQRVEAVSRQCHEVSRALSALMSEVSGVDVLLRGPAEDSAARLADADLVLGQFQGKLREVLCGVGALLNAQTLPAAVTKLGWTFAGWDTDAGWMAWRVWELGGEREMLSDRRADGLRYKLERRNAEEARHG